MARLNTFYLPPDQWPLKPGDTVELIGDEARHMLTVLRTGSDQTVRLFDGEGNDGLFRVENAGKKRAILEALELNEHTRPQNGLTLAIGWGKSKRRNYLFEKAVELQADGIAFWEAVRSQGQQPDSSKETWMDKCVQAAKQCGNPFIPEIHSLSDGVAGVVEFARDFDRCYLAWESDTATELLSPNHLKSGRSLIVIGPEGGMEDDEARRLMDSGFIAVTLGKSILRWETAAAYCLSLGWFAKQETA